MEQIDSGELPLIARSAMGPKRRPNSRVWWLRHIMNSLQAMLRKLASISIFAPLVVCALVGPAAAQNVLATVAIPTASAGQIAVNPALGRIYTGGGPNAGSSLTVIDGSTFSIITTISSSAGVSADMKQDNFWGGTGSAGGINVYAGANNSQISSVSVGSCPAAVAFDCGFRRVWVSSSCGTGNDPVWVFNADNLTQIGSAITPGGTIVTPPVLSPDSDKLYVTAGGVSKEIDPKTFAVTNTTYGTVMAEDSNTAKIFATSGNNLQIIGTHKDTVIKTVTLSYTPAAMAVNNAMAHVYLLNPAGGFIDVYNEVGKKLATFTLTSGNQPNSIAVDSARGRIFVDVFNTGTSAWSLMVMEDLSTVRKCYNAGSCDY